MKTKLTTLIILLVSIASFSQTFTIDFINYNVTSTSPNTVEITGTDSASDLASNLIIPETVTDNGIAYTVTSIAFRAFRQKRKIVNLTIPATMVTIGNEAFQDNPITEIIALGSIPPSINSNGTFSNKNTIDITVPVGTETTYENVGWTGFASINGNPSVGFKFDADNGFTYTITSSNPNEVSLTNGNTASGVITIANTVSFNGISFNVTAIGASAFVNNSVTSAEIASLVESIGNNAFRGNTGLTSVTSNNTTAPTLGTNVFLDTAEAKSLNIPNGSETSYVDAGWSTNFFSINGTPSVGFKFDADNGFRYTVTSSNPNEVSLTNGNTASGAITISGTVSFNGISFNVTAIGASAFINNNVTNVVITSLVESIGNNAFRGNTGLSAVTSNSTTAPTLGSNVFLDTTLGIALNIPDGSETSYTDAGWSTNFFSVNGIVIIGNSFTADNGFTYTVTSGDPNEVSLTNGNNASGAITISGTVSFKDISSRVTAIGNNAFRDDSVTSVVITSLVESIGDNAFRGNIELNSVTSNNTTAPILGNNVFLNTATDKALTIPDSSGVSYEEAGWTDFTTINGVILGNTFIVNNLRYEVVSALTNEVAITGGTPTTTDLVIPSSVSNEGINFSVTAVGDGAFTSFGLTSVSLPDTIKTIGNTSFGSNSLTSVVIPNSVISMSINAFKNNNIETVVLSENLTSLSTSLFENNNITEVVIPASITTVGSKVFRGNPLTKAIVKGTEPASISGIGANDSFGLSRDTIDLFIPTGTEQSYTDAGWTGFKSITEVSFDIFLSPKVFLQGAALNPNTDEETLMRDDLRIASLIPTTSPYEDTLTIDADVLVVEGENAIVDWVFVELRDEADSSIVIVSQSALLQRDGDVVATDGVSALSFSVDVNDYFVAIKHRNHLGIITANTVSLSSITTTLDFTNDANLVTGGATAVTEISTGTFALFSGDTNNDEGIRLTDRAQVRAVLGERDFYSDDDVDMNGIIQLSEIISIVQNLGNLQQFTTTTTDE